MEMTLEAAFAVSFWRVLDIARRSGVVFRCTSCSESLDDNGLLNILVAMTEGAVTGLTASLRCSPCNAVRAAESGGRVILHDPSDTDAAARALFGQ